MTFTPEKFISNILEDAEYFGDELALGLYEDIFSGICGYRVSLGGLYEEAEIEALTLSEARPFANLGHDISGPLPPLKSKAAAGLDAAAAAADIPAAGLDAAAKAAEGALEAGAKLPSMPKYSTFWSDVASGKVPAPAPGKSGLLSKIGGFLKGIPGKLKNLFTGLKNGDITFGQLFKKGLGWVAANPAQALGTAGGAALLFMIIRSLRKRGQLRKFQALNRIAQQNAALREDAYDTVMGDTPEKKAMRELLEACRTNRRLEKALFEKDPENTVFGY